MRGGWYQKESLPTGVSGGKYVKGGGALVNPIVNDTWVLCALRGNKSKEFYKYTPNIGNWTALCTLSFGTKPPPDTLKINKKAVDKGGSLCWTPTYVYATKGAGTKEFWRYDISTNGWSQRAFVPVPKGLKNGTSMCYCNMLNRIYLLAGSQKKDDPTNFYYFDVNADTSGGTPWHALTKAPLTPNTKVWKDGSCLAFAYGNYVYALKGGDKNNFFWQYEIHSDTINGTPWIEMETIPLIHPQLGLKKKNKVSDGGAMAVDGYTNNIYAIKGNGKQDFWKYDPNTNIWTPKDTIPRLHKKSVPKTGAGLAYNLANMRIYLLKGNNTPEFWEYIEPAYTKEQIAKRNLTEQSFILTNKTYPLMLYQNSPNPFNSQTAIRYTLPANSKVSLSIYDVSGKLVKTLVDEFKDSGVYSAIWSGFDDNNRKVGQGVYFYALKTDGEKMQKKMLMLR